MAPTLDVGLTIGALLVADRRVGNPQVQFGCTEEQVEIAEVGRFGGDFLVVGSRQKLADAERVFGKLAE